MPGAAVDDRDVVEAQLACGRLEPAGTLRVGLDDDRAPTRRAQGEVHPPRAAREERVGRCADLDDDVTGTHQGVRRLALAEPHADAVLPTHREPREDPVGELDQGPVCRVQVVPPEPKQLSVVHRFPQLGRTGCRAFDVPLGRRRWRTWCHTARHRIRRPGPRKGRSRVRKSRGGPGRTSESSVRSATQCSLPRRATTRSRSRCRTSASRRSRLWSPSSARAG